MPETTIFSKIIDRQLPADIIYEDDYCIAINDIAPKAPTHILVIPKQAIPRLVDASQADEALLGHLLLAAGAIARQIGVEDAFRLIINNGEAAGQTVFHLHLHILAGKNFSESQLGF